MFDELPERLKKQVRYLLETNNFTKAKEIHDLWVAENLKKSDNSLTAPEFAANAA